MREFHFNSVVARYVRDSFAEYGNVETVFVYDDTGVRDVPLKERVTKANDWNADVYLSIHANAYGEGDWNDVSGIETFVYTSASKASRELADKVQAELLSATGRKDRGVKTAGFYVLKYTKMPAILAENGFMTNREEAELLKSDAYRRKCAEAIVKATASQFGLKRKPAPAPTQTNGTITVLDTFVDDKKNGVKYDGFVYDGRTYAEVRKLAETHGRNVHWNGKNVELI